MPLHKSLNNIAVHKVMERVSFCLDADRWAQCHKFHITHSCLPKRGQPALL